MKLNEYQEMSKRTMPTVGDVIIQDGCEVVLTESLIKANYAMGISGEAGEVTDLLKKQLFHGHAIDPKKVKKELGDVMHYAAGLATLYGFTLEEVTTENIDKLMKRYPEGFSSERSVNRVE
ncbi:MAG: nucleoside triphosphate pyrophosphohydrolase family protein [Bacillus sp. (in: firmicutes)]